MGGVCLKENKNSTSNIPDRKELTNEIDVIKNATLNNRSEENSYKNVHGLEKWEEGSRINTNANDLDCVFKNVWIGGQKASLDKDRLKKLGIKYILNVTC